MKLVVLLLLIGIPLHARTIRLKGGQTIDLEDYVVGVLAGEASTFTSSEAMKAMAVSARSFAVFHLGRHRAQGFDLCDRTHCQKLVRSQNERQDLRRAVLDTEHELLWFEGRPAAAHYHRHCGGLTAAAAEIWPDLRAPYLRSRPDTFCLARGHAEWKKELDMDVRVIARTRSGRIARIAVNGRQMPAEQFGWNVLGSNRYDAEVVNGRTRITGSGFGHGVGLCQTGAEERGKSGMNYFDILKFYYPGAVVGVAASGLRWQHAVGDRVDAFAVDLGGAQELASLSDAALRNAERVTGFRVDVRPKIRSYPSLSIYRDATGSSGAVAATATGSIVRMQPLGLLRSRGILVSTLKHEMLHVAVDTQAAPGLPSWFIEGLTVYLANGGPSGYAQAYARVRRLAEQRGLPTLLQWVRSGLPPDASQPPDRTRNVDAPPLRNRAETPLR